MPLTPDEVERHTFPIADWGYERGDVHKFLVEVAATLRYALHSSFPTVTVVNPTPPSPATTEVHPDLSQLGNQVNEVIRAAETVAASVRDQAEAEATEIRARAELDASDRRRDAEIEVNALKDQARRVLQAAEQQAAAVIADAERQAQDARQRAVDQGRRRAERLERRAAHHAEQVRRYEEDVHERLSAARSDLDRAIIRLAGSPRYPVVDLSTQRPGVRVGSLTAGHAAPDGTEADPPEVIELRTPEAATVGLMRAAITRAADFAAGYGPTDEPAARPLPVPGTGRSTAPATTDPDATGRW